MRAYTTQGAEAGGFLNLTPEWSTSHIPGLLRLHRETMRGGGERGERGRGKLVDGVQNPSSGKMEAEDHVWRPAWAKGDFCLKKPN